MDTDTKLDAAYALKTPEDNKRLYAAWADDYESDFVAEAHYDLPAHVVDGYVSGVKGPAEKQALILDVGAGTGLVGALLAEAGFELMDGLDISAEMLGVARQKGCYRHLYEADMTQKLSQIPDGCYGGIVSAGTFTNGHVGPDALDELLRVSQPGAFFALSINAEHWHSKAFQVKFERLAAQISAFRLEEARVYGEAASGAHRNDICYLALFEKR